MADVAAKVCSKCKLTRHSNEFFKDNSKKDGIRTICKDCDLKRRRGGCTTLKSHKTLSTMSFPCIRQAYNCDCEQCMQWKARWDAEDQGFLEADNMISQGKSIFEIYEMIRTKYPQLLQHHKYFEKIYFQRIYGDNVPDSTEPTAEPVHKKIRLDK